MVPGYWQFASVLVLTLFVSTSAVLTDTPACDSGDQHCLVPPKSDALTQQQRNLDKERQNPRESNRQDRAERDINRNLDHHQNKFLVHTNRESRRLYDRIRDVKKSALDRRNLPNTRDSRRLRGNRRYIAGERLTDLHSSEIESSEHDAERPDTLRDRLLHRFALTASENGYLTARAQRRLSRFHDDVENARMTSRFERLQKDRMERLNRENDGSDGVKVVTRFERSRNDRISRLSKSDANLRVAPESDHLLPRHFQNHKRIRESIGRRESGFERRNAYAAIIRNQVRVSDDTVKAERIEPRFEVQRKHRQELETELKKESVEGVKNEDQEAYLENRKMRKEQRREMEERVIAEEKQHILEEERRIREEAERVREREQKLRETERRIQEIIRQIREKERRAREEKQKKLNEEKRIRQSVPEREDDKWLEERERLNVHDNGQRIHYGSDERIRDYEDRINRQGERQDYDGERQTFDSSDEEDWGWDYSDYSNSNSAEDSYEDDWELERRIREDIRLFPDIQRQIRENVQMYGREYLDARETFSDEIDDDSRRNTEHRTNDGERTFRDERREEKENNNERRKRSLEEKNRSIQTERRFRHSSELNANKENRQIAENRSFRSQDERLIRKVNLRRMDEMRRLVNRNDRIDLALQRREDNRRTKYSRDRRVELNRNEEMRDNRINAVRQEDKRILDWNVDSQDRRTESKRTRRFDLTLKRRDSNRRITDSRFCGRRSELERNDRMDMNSRRRESGIRFDSRRNERRIERADITLERRRDNNRRIEESHDRQIESEKSVERRDRVDENSERLEGNRRLEDSRDRRIELENGRRNERSDDRINTVLQRRSDERRFDNSPERRIESRRNERRTEESDRRLDDRRNHRIELERNNDERRNNRVEMNLERREENGRIEKIREINERRSNRIEDTPRRIESSRHEERNQHIRNTRVDSQDQRAERDESRTQNELVLESSRTERRQLNDEIFSKPPLDKVLMSPKQNQYASTIHLLQAALIGVMVLKMIMQQENFEKKFRSHCYFEKLGSVLNNLKVF